MIPSTGQPVVRVEGLSYEVDGRRILDQLSLELEARSIVSIMGPSGCGKTTFLKVLMGLNRPTAGRIWIEGTEITGLSEEEMNRVRQRMGYVFQYAALFDSLTVGENVAFGLRRFADWDAEQVEARVQEVLAAVGLPGIENRYPAQLSGGMKKRVGLARAIAPRPCLVLYDEPSSGLDPVNAASIDRLILQMREEFGVTSLVVSHHVQNVFGISDRIAMMHRGRFLLVGTPLEFRQAENEIVRQFIRGRAEGPLNDVAVGES